MITVFKGLQEKATNYDYNELYTSCKKAAEPHQKWWTVEPVATIPENEGNKFVSMPIGGNGFRHDAWIFDLEPNDYVIVVSAAPNVSAKQKVL